MEIKEEKKNSKVKIVIFLLIIVALVAIVGFAYARYVTRLNGTTTADIAQWSFKVNEKTNENFVIDSATNYIYTTGDNGLLYIGCVNTQQENLDIIWENTDVQIEEGTEITEYEPYILSASTPVTQNKNHTLTAIWEPNP